MHACILFWDLLPLDKLARVPTPLPVLCFGWACFLSVVCSFLSVRLGASHVRLVVVIYLTVEPPDEVRGAKARTGAVAADELHGCYKSTGA